MKKATNRILSFLTAFAMVIGVLVAPFTSANAAPEDEKTNTVVVHKMLMTKDQLDAHDVNKEGYDGNKIQDLGTFFGKGAEEIPGVYFVVEKEFDVPDTSEGAEEGATVKAWKAVKADGTQAKDDLSDALGGLTEEIKEGETVKYTALELNTSNLPAGTYRINEIHEKSTYVGEEGKTLTDMKAVPTEITLPLVNNDGVVKEAHVYPKNIEEKPQIDKNFAKDNTLEEVKDTEGFYTEKENELVDQTGGITEGPNYDNYQKKKKIAEGEVGKQIPYEVNTEIPANSKLKLAKWDDNMSAGLTYNKDLKLTIDGKEVTNTDETTYYTIKETDSGFVLTLEEEGLKLISDQANAVTVALAYSATVNSDAIADMPETNDVKFNYGNNPSKATEPRSTTPKNGELTVEKTWDDGVWAKGESATFELRDAETGRVVTKDDLVYTSSEDDEAAKKAFEDYKNSFDAVVELKKGETTATHTWKYLDGTKEYTAIEIASTTLSDAEYTEAADGTIKVTNHKSNNPQPLNPTEPKVVVGGKKFVKTNQEGTERLAGAEFYVKDSTGKKYLVADQKDAKAVTDAKAALDKAVETYNNLTAKEQNEAAKKAVTDAQEAYNKAFKENATAYKWEETNKNAVVLTADGQGKFEISGLEYGSYKLEEKTAPKGYAKLNGDIDFKVEKGSYKGTEKEFKYEVTVDTEKGEKQTYGLQVKNKKVSIPQTGGIGSLIFIVAGLAIMGVAFVAMKKRNAVEA